ncbi:MAG TPA: hypothetical protein VL404_03415 [Candidatus Eisenbacteria bacterium]|jgi:hypothetical protein|nr:hypothetical protein [Candidatus Eisenbacteria bacterium]
MPSRFRFFSLVLALCLNATAAFAAQPIKEGGPQPPAGVSGPSLQASEQAVQNHVDKLNDLETLSQQNQGDSTDEKAAVVALGTFSPIYDNTSASENGQGTYMAVWIDGGKLTVWKENGNHIQVWTYNLTTNTVGYTTITPSGRTHEDYAAGDQGYFQGLKQMDIQVSHLLHDPIITTPASIHRLDVVEDFLSARISEL